jgi:hypothetical protein
MANRDKYWSKVGKFAFLLLAAYVVCASFWCSAAGISFKTRELDRDHRFHEAAEGLKDHFNHLAEHGVERPDKEASFVKAEAEFAALAVQIEKESNADFRGTDAMMITAFGAGPMLGLFFLVAWTIRPKGVAPAAVDSSERAQRPAA